MNVAIQLDPLGCFEREWGDLSFNVNRLRCGPPGHKKTGISKMEITGLSRKKDVPGKLGVSAGARRKKEMMFTV